MVIEAENGDITNGASHTWLRLTYQSSYTGTSYVQTSPDIDALYQTNEITASPVVAYPINVTTPGTYTLWLRGYASNASGDSAYVDLGGQTVDVTGFAPGEWSWATTTTGGITATLSMTTGGVYTANLLMREDGLRIDRLLLTTDTTFIPAGFGPPETERQLGSGGLVTPLTRTIVYTYDNLYRLTEADYTTGENYQYSYDKVGNRLQQIIDGDTTTYQYDAANRLEQLNGQSVYTFDNNGNLLNSDVLTNTWDAANRLTQIVNPKSSIVNRYNGMGDPVGQTVGLTTTYFALDSASALPEVIYTTEGNLYLHLPGVIMAESGTGEIRYLLSDGLGSVRQATDESGEVVAYNEFDPYGNPVQDDSSPYGFTGEWWENEVGLLHLRARWYAPETGTFLSRDPVESEPPYVYVRGNPVNQIDPSGMQSAWPDCLPPLGADDLSVPPGCVPPQPPPECLERAPGDILPVHCYDYPHNLLPPYQSPSNPNQNVIDAIGLIQQELNNNQGLYPPGFQDIANAIVNSKLQGLRQGDDGIIFGFSVGTNVLPMIGHGIFNSHPENLVEMNGFCLPASGVIPFGLEVVYDFRHQERGIFTYGGNILNVGATVNAGGVAYIGKTRGFVNADYDQGVLAYAGPFASLSLNLGHKSVGPLGGSIIEAAPLQGRDKALNPNGVFATYYGAGIGVSAPGSPASVEFASTVYTPLPGIYGRTRYIPLGGADSLVYWNILSEQDIINIQKSKETYRRKTVAALMTAELTNWGLSSGLARPFIPQALQELWSYVDNP